MSGTLILYVSELVSSFYNHNGVLFFKDHTFLDSPLIAPEDSSPFTLVGAGESCARSLISTPSPCFSSVAFCSGRECIKVIVS